VEYDIPEELAVLSDKLQAAEYLRDKYIKIPFGFKRAKKCATEAAYFRRKFWKGVCKIYPELKDKSASYNHVTQKIKSRH